MNSYAVWNNKGGVGKTYLSFVIATEYAEKNPDKTVLIADMCPQANLSEIVLGGNGTGAANLEGLIERRNTIGGYFDERIESPHRITGTETSYLIKATDYNPETPDNLYLIAGDPSLEIQSQVINQISSQQLPVNSWKNVHLWLRDLINSCSHQLGQDNVFCLVDCNPSFSAYTEIALLACDHMLIPCSSDGSSARAMDNIGQLVYGLDVTGPYQEVGFSKRCRDNQLQLPKIKSLIFNRSTQYNQRASKAFNAMYGAIKDRADAMCIKDPSAFYNREVSYSDIPDNHSVAIVSSHCGRPLYSITQGRYTVHDITAQINNEPLDRYKEAIAQLVEKL
ncbi:ParA family protein [Halomonas sp. GDM18]|nr:ParA family protein [Halomonas sp. GDM18]